MFLVFHLKLPAVTPHASMFQCAKNSIRRRGPLVDRNLFVRIVFATDLSQPAAKLFFRRDDGRGDVVGRGLQLLLQREPLRRNPVELDEMIRIGTSILNGLA